MTRSELIRQLAEKHPSLSYRQVDALVGTVFGEIAQALSEGKRVELRGFGSFSVKVRGPRKARNPRSGDIVSVGQRRSPRFKCGKRLAERLNTA